MVDVVDSLISSGVLQSSAASVTPLSRKLMRTMVACKMCFRALYPPVNDVAGMYSVVQPTDLLSFPSIPLNELRMLELPMMRILSLVAMFTREMLQCLS